MSRNFTLESLDSLTPEELLAFDASDLFELQGMVSDAEANLKRRKDKFTAALEAKYSARAGEARKLDMKKTGTVKLAEGELEIVCELPKDVKWNTEILAARWDQIKAAGEDPSVYMKRTLEIGETVYAGLPEAHKLAFQPARTEGTKKAKFSIIKKKA